MDPFFQKLVFQFHRYLSPLNYISLKQSIMLSPKDFEIAHPISRSVKLTPSLRLNNA